MDLIFVVLAVWVIFCFIVASMAKKRGRDQTGYVLLAIFFSPLIAIIILLISGESDEKRLEKVKEEEEIRYSVKSQDVVAAPVTTISSTTKYESLEKLGTLLEKGIITKEEFEAEKKTILSDNSTNKKQENPITHDQATKYEILHDEIKKTKSGVTGGLNKKITDTLESICIDEKQTIDLLDNYQRLYKKDLTKSLCDLSSSYDTIKAYVTPLIAQGVVETKYPHSRVK
jgi:hypothetical protein